MTPLSMTRRPGRAVTSWPGPRSIAVALGGLFVVATAWWLTAREPPHAAGDARAPFHIGQLRGARFAPGLDPDLEQMPPFTGRYTTADYLPDALSPADDDSPHKQKRLELLGHDRDHRGAAGP